LSHEEIMIPYRFINAVLAVGLGLVALAALPAVEAEEPDSQRIAKLIAQLNSGSFRQRQEATRALEAMGTPALEALHKAAQSSDPEVRHRAEELVKKINRPAEMAKAAKLVAALHLHLKYQDIPLEQAVEDLAKKTGYPISLGGDKAKRAGRRVTLDTGETTFWEAFDLLCRKADLVEERAAMPKKGAVGGMGLLPPGGPGQLPAPQGMPVPKPGQPPAPQGMPPAPGGMRLAAGGFTVALHPSAAKLVLVDGKPPLLPTCYAGAIRVRALAGVAKSSGEIQVALEVTAEPRMQWRRPINAHIDQAVDDRGQTLPQAADTPAPGPGMVGVALGMASPRQVTVNLRTADKPSKALKLLKGTVTGEVQIPLGELVEVKNILQAARQTVQGKEGTSLEVLQASRQKDGAIRVEVKLTTPTDIVPAMTDQDLPLLPPLPATGQPPLKLPGLGQPQPPKRDGLVNLTGLALLDEKGQSLPLADANKSEKTTGNSVTHQVTLTFRPKKGQGEPVKLRFTGARIATIGVPFILQDVPLR
jgi:hypothetical protein